MEIVVKTAADAIDSSKEQLGIWLRGLMGNVLKGILLGIIDNSYWICLLVCLIAFLCYMCGHKKAAKYSSLSIAVYFVLRAIKGVI